MDPSSADRVVFPNDHITKGDVFRYYEMVGPRLLPFIANRALTVERFPKGIADKGFMQKNAPGHAPAGVIERLEVPRDEGGVTTYPIVHDVDGVLFFANLGVITFHAPPSLAVDMLHPDWVIWDLDPPVGSGDKARAAALALREVLQSFGVPTSVMTSGSKGFHLRTHVTRTMPADRMSAFARGVSALAAAAHPELMTLAFKKVERGNRVFLDWLRNMPLSTSVAPWSLRPKDRAPVAAPITWDEVEDIEPDGITIDDVPNRLEYDAWAKITPMDPTDSAEKVKRALKEGGITLGQFDRFRS